MNVCAESFAKWPEWVYRAGILEKHTDTQSPEKALRSSLGKSSPASFLTRTAASPKRFIDSETHQLSSTLSPVPKKYKQKHLLGEIARSEYFTYHTYRTFIRMSL
jgi:hypothetical protein